MFSVNKIFLICFFALVFHNCFGSDLPAGFIDLKEIDPSIKIFAVGATNINFMGRPIKGYNVPDKIIVSKALGLALKEVQKELKSQRLSLLVYDAYRPQMAVDDFINWGKSLDDQKMKKWLYPRVDKAMIFAKGYVAKRSSHSRGSAVDLTIISVDKNINETQFVMRKLPSGETIPHYEDGSIDMGTSVGLFDELSWTDNKDIPIEGQKNRQLLKNIMQKHGFKNYSKEWWHYTLKNEPFPDIYFNFPIE